MKNHLQDKLTQTTPYTDQELDWLLTHIGDPDHQIRDQLVYASLAHALIKGLVTPEQARWLFEAIEARGLQTLGLDNGRADSLTRSFTSLLHSLLLYVDNDQHSQLKGFLTSTERANLANRLLDYLPRETDYRGYQDPIGWVHAIAHGADALLTLSCHDHFPLDQLNRIWETIKTLLNQTPVPLSSGEPGRLATVLAQNILCDRLGQDQVANWLKELIIPGDDPISYTKQLNCQAFLSALYFQLEIANQLGPDLRNTLMNHPHLIH